MCESGGGVFTGVALCDPVLQTSFVALIAVISDRNHPITTFILKTLPGLYNVRSCLMNNHQEKGDVLDPSSTEMFGNSPENV